MQLNNLVLDASPKTSWQCFDLGCRVAVADYKTLLGYWLVLTFPIFILLISLDISFGLFVFYLFKPWYERGLLYILSRTVFGTSVNIKQTLLALPSQIKPLWFSSVTYRRLAPSRSFDMAVTQLENLSGERRSRRLKVLHKSVDDNTAWWTICCVHWESFLSIALITLVQILLPAKFDLLEFIEYLSVSESLENYVFTFCVYFSIALVAPFYVAGGFVAYLNRRVILEGWDIELGFSKWREEYLEKVKRTGSSRQLNLASASIQKQKPDNTSETKNKLVIAIFIFAGFSFSTSDIVYAQTTEPENIQTTSVDADIKEIIDPKEDPFAAEKQAIQKDIHKVLDEPPFSQKETRTVYRWKSSTAEDEDIDISNTDLAWLAAIAGFMAKSFEIILWVLFIFMFTYLIYRNWGNITAYFGTTTSKVVDAPLPSFISTAFKEELPDDIVSIVQEAITNENFRRALSILVRASFTYLSKEQHIRITKSMTENECLLEIKQTCPEQVYAYMQSLLTQWMKMAWAHQLPNAETLLHLTKGYSENFTDNHNVTGSTSHHTEKEPHNGGEK